MSEYYARSDMWSFWKHNWINGVWAVLPFLYSSVRPVTWRHLVPLFFILALLVGGALSIVLPYGPGLFYVVAGSYSLATILASLHIAFNARDLRYAFVMPFVFSSLHVGYGLGSVWGILKAGYLFITSRQRLSEASKSC